MGKIDTLEPAFKEKILLILAEAEAVTGYVWGVPEARRTIAYQDALFNQPHDGKDNDGDGRIDESDEMVTKAKGGNSSHNFGLGADLVPMKKGKFWWGAPREVFLQMAEIAEKHGLVTGIRWTDIFPPNGDMPHVQDPAWKVQQALWKAAKIKVA